MNRALITKLLIAAMQRHITWIPSDSNQDIFVPNGWKAFSIDESVSYSPPYDDVSPTSKTYFTWSRGKLEQALRDHTPIHFETWGDIANESPSIAKGVYFLTQLSDRLHPYTIYSPEPIDDSNTDYDEGRIIYSYRAIELVIAITHSDNGGEVSEANIESRFISLFELLTLIALQDAKRAGREDDIEALSHLIPYRYGSNLTEAQEAEILEHIGEAKPDIVRTGKVWTDIMGASSRNRTFEGNGISAPIGTALTFAGANEDTVIHTHEAGKALSIDAGTMKLLYQLNAMVTEADPEKGKEVDIETSFAELMEPRRMNPKSRKQKDAIKRQIQALEDARLKFQNREVEDGSIPIVTGRLYYRRGGRIQITIGAKFKMLLLGHNAGLTPVDPVLLTTDDVRHPHAWAIGSRLNAHAYMNYGKPTAHRMSVTSLLGNVKSIPTVEALNEVGVRGDKARTARIIVPLERDLTHLVEIGFLKYWDYCHSNDEPLTDEEQDARIGEDGEGAALPYSIAKDCLVTWEPTNDYVGHMQAVTDARTRKKVRDAEAREAGEAEAEKRARRIERKTETAIARMKAKAVVEGTGGESAPPLSQNRA